MKARHAEPDPMNTAALLKELPTVVANGKVYKNANSAKASLWAAANPERRRAIRMRYNAKNRGKELVYRNQKPLNQLINGARSSARKRGLEFSITLSDLSIVPFCPVLGIKLDWSYGTKGRAMPNSPSIDRMDNSRGYVQGNVCIISHRANMLKRDATLEEIEAIAGYMRQPQLHARGDRGGADAA